MKNLKNLKNTKILSKKEQQTINGGQYCNTSANCPRISGAIYVVCSNHNCYYAM